MKKKEEKTYYLFPKASASMPTILCYRSVPS